MYAVIRIDTYDITYRECRNSNERDVNLRSFHPREDQLHLKKGACIMFPTVQIIIPSFGPSARVAPWIYFY